MNTLCHHCQVERGGFGDLLSAEGIARLNLMLSPNLDQVLQQSPPRDQTILAVWSADPIATGQLPEMLVCSDGSEVDWSAWITTYVARIRPFSAYMRLVGNTEARMLAAVPDTPTLERLKWPVVGLILGEVLAASRLPDKSLDTVPALACAATLSFAIFRAAAMYPAGADWSRLVSGWTFVRDATHQRPRAIDTSLTEGVCAAIIEAAGLDQHRKELRTPWATGNRARADVQVACRELIDTHGSIATTAAGNPAFAAVEGMMKHSREDRVIAINDVIRAIGDAAVGDRDMISLILGYLVNRIAPGTMRHSSVLSPILDRYPAALLWYGFCAGFGGGGENEERSSSVRHAGVDLPASARRVVRDLLRPELIVGSPVCDIGILELAALARTGRDPLDGLVTATPGAITVELMPGVWTAVNNRGKANVDEEALRRPHDMGGLAAIQKDLRAALDSIERVRRGVSRLAGGEVTESRDQQRSLFGTKRRRRE
jgi:hypothetical protein